MLAEQVFCIQSASLIRMFIGAELLINAEKSWFVHRASATVIYWEPWDVFGSTPVP